jgi:hypothetical protein
MNSRPQQRPWNESRSYILSKGGSWDAYRMSGAGSAFVQLGVTGIAQQWLEETLGKVSRKSDTATAVRYTLGGWEAPLRYCDDCGLLIENNAAERALRVVALDRKNFLFAGFDGGDQNAALVHSLIGTAKLNYLNPEGYLPEVLSRIPENPINRIAELLPTNIETGCTDDVLRTD